jgi:hypothetical protein
MATISGEKNRVKIITLTDFAVQQNNLKMQKKQEQCTRERLEN